MFLDLKYRPVKFHEVVGNHGPTSVLLKRSQTNSLRDRSILLGGPKGCGKTTLARIIARAVSCISLKDGEPCNECFSCKNIFSENSVSVFEFDAAAHGTVDNIRTIVDGLEYSNIDGNQTVLILDEAHRLSPASQDALLKPIEDRKLLAIFCTTEPNKIRLAIRDRLDEYSIRPPTVGDCFSMLKRICENEKIKYDDNSLFDIVSGCECSPRSCINALQSIIFMDELSSSSVSKYFKYDSVKILCQSLSTLKHDKKSFFNQIDDVLNSESPVWIRDTIIKIISTSIRQTFSASTNSRYSFNIDKSEIGFWTSVANSLSCIDKLSSYDIELALIGIPFNKIEPIPNIQEVKTDFIKPTKKQNDLTKLNTSSQSIEIDGVIFDANEKLTSFDHKINPGRGAPTNEKTENRVEFEKTKIPMSDQEFSREFTERFSK